MPERVRPVVERGPAQGRQGHRGPETAGEDLHHKDQQVLVQRDADGGVRAIPEQRKVQYKESASSYKLVQGEECPKTVTNEHQTFLF